MFSSFFVPMECKCHSPMQILGYHAFDRFDSKNLIVGGSNLPSVSD